MEILKSHLTFVLDNSRYYRELWYKVWKKGEDFPGLQRLPLTEQTGFWNANTPLDNTLLTGSHEHGVVFKSGGTTGAPKFSYFSVDDWRNFCKVFGNGMVRGGLSRGEKVANIFYGGQLYASLLFITKCLEEAGVGINYPIAGFAPTDEIIDALILFKIDTIAGVPTTIVNLFNHLKNVPKEKLNVKKILYGGEAMYQDQVDFIKGIIPHCHVQSIGIAGVDYGEMGWVSKDCKIGEFHCYDESTILEIIDDSGNVIDTPNIEGNLYITNLRRRLMPIIRYPVGDRGMWIDEPTTSNRRYRLLGRSEVGARVGPMTLYIQDIRRILEGFKDETGYINFQLIIDHVDKKDRCTLMIAVPLPKEIPAGLSDKITNAIYQERHMFPDLIKGDIVHPLIIEWTTSEGLATNKRTGKLIHLIDKRHQI
ncbi:MAG: hypothetical protein N3D15_06265 [Syntrophorhabdaceae bacterium]|nr:hypothetical protein [Syntrophorhabdaceae bacterium]